MPSIYIRMNPVVNVIGEISSKGNKKISPKITAVAANGQRNRKIAYRPKT